MADCVSFGDHIRCALRWKYRFSAAAPLPDETISAANFARDMHPDRLVRFRGDQLTSLEQLVPNCALAQENGAIVYIRKFARRRENFARWH